MPAIYPADLMPYSIIVDTIRNTLGMDRSLQEEVDTQMLCLTEEVGEAIKAWRRLTGRARILDTYEHLAEELADVIIVTRVTFMMLGIDEKEAVQAKLRAIMERGGK